MSSVSLIPGLGPVMIRVRVSRYIAGEASGSSISDPAVESGYSPLLERELARVCPGGGTIVLDREAAGDFAEWCGDLAEAVAQGGNPSGANALRKLSTDLGSVRDLTNVPTTNDAPQGQKESRTMANKPKRVVARRGGTTAAKKGGTAAKPAAKKAGGSTGRTGAVEKINANVTKIAKALRDGATRKSQKAEYGVSDDGPIRAALYRAGFDSKGAKHGEEKGSINPKNAAGKKQLVKLRKEGAAWFRLAFLADISEAEAKKVVADAGGPTGRVYTQKEKVAATSGR
jgi:hypothetical protein